MTIYVQSPFTVEWKDDGGTQGTWSGSNPTSAAFFSLREWHITPGSAFQFNFITAQNRGFPYTVFSVMRDHNADRKYGQKIFPSGSSTQLSFTPEGGLSFTASRLISGDPKLKISNSTNQPTLYLQWTPNSTWKWSYTATGPFQDLVDGTDIEVGSGVAGSAGEVQVFVTDQTSTDHVLGVYYLDAGNAPGTNVGIVQSETAIKAPNTLVTVVPQFDVRDPFTCTLNLMKLLPADTILPAATS